MVTITRVAHALTGFTALFIILISFSGCAITYNIKKDALPAPTDSAMVQQWPLAVGLYIPPSVKSKVISKDLWRVPAGKDAALTFRWALSQMFNQVFDLETLPSNDAIPSGLAGVIELTDISYTDKLPRSLRYEITLYSNGGEKIDVWTLTTTGLNWDPLETSLSAAIHSVGSEVTYCIRDITALFMVEFARSSCVRAWLENNGINTIDSGPVFRDEDIPLKSMPMVLLLTNIKTWLHTDSVRGMECIGHRLEKYVPPIKVLPVEDVRLEFFPWLEMSTAPKTEEEMLRWLAAPAVQEKARLMGWRYLVEFRGGTDWKMSGGILCTGGFGAGGCFGYSWGDKTSSFSSTIFDIWTAKAPHATGTHSGGVYIPALILPIPIIAATEDKACEELSRKIHAIITKLP